MDEPPRFGPMLRDYRRAARQTQAQLAERAACSVETIKKIEAGKLRPSQQLAELLAAGLLVPPERLEEFLSAARVAIVPRPVAIDSAGSMSHNPPWAPPVLVGQQASLAERYRRRILAKVRLYWVQGVLEPSLQGAPPLALALQLQPDATAHPWPAQSRGAEGAARSLPPGTPIAQLFDEAGQELLILGGPGAGKTTLLLELARALLDRAEADPAQPVPIFFPLTSWTRQHGSLLDWLVSELQARYSIPHKLGRQWLDAGEVVTLLDGLDEVPAAERGACVAAVNRYHQEYGVGGIAVCSRRGEYDQLPAKLQLQNAITVQPLTSPQIDAYLAQLGSFAGGLREALQADRSLREAMSSPLLVRLGLRAYQERPQQAGPAWSAGPRGAASLCAAYVERMAQGHGAADSYPREQTLRGLHWLAHCLIEQHEAVFYREQLHQGWLPTPMARRQYRALALLSSMTLFGLLGALLGSWQVGVGGGFLFGLAFAANIPLLIGKIALLIGLVCALYGVLYGGPTLGLMAGLAGAILATLTVAANHLFSRFALRLVLWRAGVLPWNNRAFLDFCADQALLQKVGRGYMFVHQLVQDYLAGLDMPQRGR